MNNTIKILGNIFTPKDISLYMSNFINNDYTYDIFDPCVGTGNLIENINNKHNIECIDINNEFIKECKIKFKNKNNIKFKNINFLEFKTNKKFDYIITNPPYIKIQNINEKDLNIMKKDYPDFIYGNTNLYIYFILKCFNLLNTNGELICIIPNSFLYNKSLIKFKNFLFDNKKIKLLIDFKDKQQFENCSTYTCIMIITKYGNKFYSYSNNINDQLKIIHYNNIINNNSLKHNIKFKIGLMTLCDKVFIIKNYEIKNNLIEFKNNNIQYSIELDSCKDILKVSKNKIFKIIYPYTTENNKIKIDLNFLEKYPKCANYLNVHKENLLKRDSGKTSKYPTWFAYGRTQALLLINKERVFLPSIVKNINDFIFKKNIELYYSGLSIVSDQYNNDQLIEIMKNNEKLILQNSSNKSSGWFGLTTNSFNNIII